MKVNPIFFFKEMIRRFTQDRVLDLSAQCAYYFMLSFFPFLLLAISILSYFPISAEDIIKMFGDVAPQTSSHEVVRNLEAVIGVRQKGLMPLGIVFTIWPALSGIESLISALNYSHHGTPEKRSFFKAKLLALVLMFGMILGISSTFVFTVLGQIIGQLAQTYFQLPDRGLEVWNSFRSVLGFAILNVVFLGFYLMAPNKKVRVLEALPGCLFASIGWHYASVGFSYYVNHFNNFSATYGSLGAIIVLMTWFYLTAMIVIIGGQINSVLVEMRE